MIREADRRLVSKDPDPAKKRDWFVNGQGQTFAIVRGPKRFRMGSSPGEPTTSAKTEAARGDAPHEREIPRSFAIATTEVTVAQYLEFVEANKSNESFFAKGPLYNPQVSPERDSPIHAVTWFQALLYCQWLSEREKLREDQMCFPPVRDLAKSLGQGKLELRSGRLDLTGYRLPSEAEWEFACRAGTTTPWFFGGTTSRLLPDYGLFLENAEVSSHAAVASQGRTERIGRHKPNDLGLFDVYGNVREWCLDAYIPYPKANGLVSDTTFQSPETVDDWKRAVRGGSFADPVAWTTSSYRNGVPADAQYLTMGFRVARTVP
jgi:formylglycine-generating enzyme required for sulfatase activity